jgi:CheY-like chemotaxis protein
MDARGSTVLVVDDDPRVRLLTARVLERIGHRAVEAASAEEALALVRDGLGSVVDLVVTDHHMGAMTGSQLIAALRLSHPVLPILLVSGEGVDTTIIRMDPFAAFLAKPFDPQELARKIDRLLGPSRIVLD